MHESDRRKVVEREGARTSGYEGGGILLMTKIEKDLFFPFKFTQKILKACECSFYFHRNLNKAHLIILKPFKIAPFLRFSIMQTEKFIILEFFNLAGH